jgi:hypothetical protein
MIDVMDFDLESRVQREEQHTERVRSAGDGQRDLCTSGRELARAQKSRVRCHDQRIDTVANYAPAGALTIGGERRSEA